VSGPFYVRRWRSSLVLTLLLGLAAVGNLIARALVDAAELSPHPWRPWLTWGGAALVLTLLVDWLKGAALVRRPTPLGVFAVGEYTTRQAVAPGPRPELATSLDQLRSQLRERDAALRTLQARLDFALDAERALTYAVTLETVLVEVSGVLLSARPELVEQTVGQVLGAIARRMELGRTCIFELSRDGQALCPVHEWRSADCPPRLTAAVPWPVAGLPRWMDTLCHGEAVCINDVEALPDAWDLERRVLLEQGVRAVLAVPLRVGERQVGCIVAEMADAPRDWCDPEPRALRLLADLIGAALERRSFAYELSQGRQRLEDASRYDALTGLPSRQFLAERMNAAMARAVATGTELAICSLDLDGFKPLNDAYGRVVGDHILQAVAARLRDQVREGDTVARLGGDEFVLLVGGFGTPVECANLLDRLVKALALPHLVEGKELRVTASAGVTLYPRDTNDADTLLRHADHALYRAKQRGRNRYRFFDPGRDRRARDRRSQVERIGEAIAADELVLYYQPKVDMRRGLVVGAEGLVRWQHPDQGLLPPGAFIPLLDGTEYQQRLDWWVIQAGLEQLQVWHDVGLNLGLSLNISARSIQHTEFVRDLGTRLRAYPGLAPDLLSLEILESEALGDLAAVARVIHECAGLGVHFALDDFGTGYSSLTYFRRLPAQVLKIDQTFVRDMLRSVDDRNIVAGVIGLAHAFGREVIAEGVESAAHGLMLLRMGCDRAQGYGVAEPMPAGQFPGWIDGYRFPALWALNPPSEWSDALLDLMTTESEHRDWVAGVIREAGPRASGHPPPMDDNDCGFGRWYAGDGCRPYRHLDSCGGIDLLHTNVHELGRAVLRARDQGQPVGPLIADLLVARNRFISTLQALQLRALSRDAAGTLPP
jgi:diguanylate cyclase (GGDEF)-like protein